MCLKCVDSIKKRNAKKIIKKKKQKPGTGKAPASAVLCAGRRTFLRDSPCILHHFFGFQTFKLHLVIVCVDAVSFQKILVGTAFSDTVFRDDDNLVGVPDRGERCAMVMVVRFFARASRLF